MTFYIFHRHRVCLVDHVDLICSLYNWWEGIGSSSLAILPLGFDCGFIFTSTCGSSMGVLLLRLPWRASVEVLQLLLLQGSGSTRYSGGLAPRAEGNTML